MKTIHKKPRTKLPRAGEERTPLPSRDSVKKFLAEAPGKVGLREVARAFSVGPDGKKGLRGIMRSLEADGALDRAGGKKYQEAGRLPENAVVEVTGIDRDG
jgi:ribonuclease R